MPKFRKKNYFFNVQLNLILLKIDKDLLLVHDKKKVTNLPLEIFIRRDFAPNMSSPFLDTKAFVTYQFDTKVPKVLLK